MTTGPTAAPDARLRALAARAAPLHARLAALSHATRDADVTRLSAAATALGTLSAWRTACANGDDDAFRARLAWDGWTEADGAAAARSPAPSETLPRWAETFRAAYGATPEAVAAAFDALPAARDRALRPDAPLPFETLVLPLLAYARARVRDVAGAAYDVAADAAHATTERALLERLTNVVARPLYVSFAVYRSGRPRAGLAALFGGGDPAESAYAPFEAGMRRGGLFAFFEEYAVAARLCATATELWVDATAELLTRAAADAPALAAMLGRSEPLGAIADVTLSLADPHSGGRAVTIVRWTDGTRTVYKPRAIGLERVFAELVSAVNASTGDAPRLRTIRLVERGTYGWMEFVEAAPCATEAEVARYYERCGMLLGIAYALNGTDFHLENLIAAGEHPVLIDMETLVGHRFAVGDGSDARRAGQVGSRAAEESVLNVRMLPALKVTDDGLAFDVGALGGTDELETPAAVRKWAGVNTDGMRSVTAVVRATPPGNNRPTLSGRPADAGAYVEQVVAGFERAYAALERMRDGLLASNGLLDRLRREPARLILRNTSLYGSLLERCLHPNYLRDGMARSAELDALARPLVAHGSRPAVWPALAAEHRALEQLDVPLFAAPADSTGLPLDDGAVVEGCFEATAYSEAMRRLQVLGPSDRRRQAELIRAAFSAHAARGLRLTAVRAVEPPNAIARVDDALAARACERAVAVGDALWRQAVTDGAGVEAGWIGVAYVPKARRYAVTAGAQGLFDGYAGYALFFAALERIAPCPSHRARALAAARPLTGSVDDFIASLRVRRGVDVGAGTGLASVVYALSRIGDWLGDPRLVDDARRIAAAMRPEHADGAADLVAGLAGAVAGLVALHEQTRDDALLGRAYAFAARLLAARAAEPSTGLRGWPGRHGAFETGMAHGQAGTAYALARLALATGDAPLGGTSPSEAAVEAIALERHLLGADLAATEAGGDAGDNVRAAWSHGAAGIGLARLGALAAWDDEATRREIDDALCLTTARLTAGVDGLCCGTMGRAELLLTAAERLARPELHTLAREAAACVLARADARGAFDTGWADGAVPVGLFHGSPGVAYQLLRVARPDALPSLLLWA